MNSYTKIKQQILKKIIEILDQRIESTKQAIATAKESRDNETKCSSGDKYETSRTLMQLEVEKNRVLLNQTLNIRNELIQISFNKKFYKVEFGSLVFTNSENYFISFAIGKIEVENQNFYSISIASPIGKALKDKTPGMDFQFQNRKIIITEII